MAKKYFNLTVSYSDEMMLKRVRAASFILKKPMHEIITESFNDYVKKFPNLDKTINDTIKTSDSITGEKKHGK